MQETDIDGIPTQPHFLSESTLMNLPPHVQRFVVHIRQSRGGGSFITDDKVAVFSSLKLAQRYAAQLGLPPGMHIPVYEYVGCFEAPETPKPSFHTWPDDKPDEGQEESGSPDHGY